MITEDMTIMEIMEEHPEVIPVLAKYGLRCAGCIGMSFETLEDAAEQHGLEIEDLLEELNQTIQKKTIRPKARKK